MRFLCLLLITAFFASGTPARAQVENFIDVCGNPDADPRDVIDFCQRAIDTGKLGPQAEAQVRINKGIGYFEIGEYSSAVGEYTLAIDISPDMIAAYLNRAKAFEKQKRLQDAALDYQAAIELDPNAADAYLGRGAMLLKHGDANRAVSDLTAAMGLQPAWIAPVFNRGVAYLRLAQFAAAETDFTTVIQRNPDDAGAFLNRGRARGEMGKAEAVEDFDTAVQLDPEWAGAWFARGRYRDKLGDREGANADFRRAWELGYPDPWLIKRMREISG
ncbi:MAG: tetratricopeptide repeat protein [Pseudomonadota bacterium]